MTSTPDMKSVRNKWLEETVNEAMALQDISFATAQVTELPLPSRRFLVEVEAKLDNRHRFGTSYEIDLGSMVAHHPGNLVDSFDPQLAEKVLTGMEWAARALGILQFQIADSGVTAAISPRERVYWASRGYQWAVGKGRAAKSPLLGSGYLVKVLTRPDLKIFP